MSSAGLPPQRRFDGKPPYPRFGMATACTCVHDNDNDERSQLTETTESWVELSSQPSSSSLSSIGDEIVTTGLQVGGGSEQHRTANNTNNTNSTAHRRRRTLPLSARSLPHQQTAFRTTSTSSQEEYDESESEDDQVLTSSTEQLSHPSGEEAIEDDSDGDNATALGLQQPTFRPQPNVFSHPPNNRSNSTTSAPPSHPHGSHFTRPSFSQRSQTSRAQRGGPSFMSPSIREDNDAALRASLTTLLSCAAAARGLPKSKEEAEAQRAAAMGVGPSNQPMGLRLVPESELVTEQPSQARPRAAARNTPARSPSMTGTSSPKSKRSSSAGRQTRTSSKKKTAKTATAVQEETYISPTLLTWVVSAGVVVLVSVVGFGAGYVIGREVGRQEGLSLSAGSVNETSSAGRDVMRSSTGTLRRFKWSAVGKTIAAVG